MAEGQGGHGRDRFGRFIKNHSGNPKGPPSKEPQERKSLFRAFLETPVRVTIAGRTRDVTTEEAAQFRTLQDAMAGKAGAIARVTGWLIRREQWRSKEAEKELGSKWQVTFVYSQDPQNAVPALRILGIATRNERWDELDPDLDRSVLERWAVQAALDRRGRASALESEAISEIESFTRDAKELVWPKGTKP